MKNSNNSEMARIAVSKSLLKEYRSEKEPRIVYLSDNDEFQIQLFNPTGDVVGAEISVNGDTMPGMLVLNPGERVWLERYLDTHSKLRFSTYSVDDGDGEVRKAIANNGQVMVMFYKEKVFQKSVSRPWILYNQGITTGSPVFGEPYTTCFSSDTGNTRLMSNFCDFKTDNDGVAGTCVNGTKNARSFSSVANNTGDTGISTLISSLVGDMDTCETKNAIETPQSKSIETGRVSKGGYSSQDFRTVNKEFEILPFRMETIKLMPKSQKPYTANDLQKLYCTSCGRKIKTGYKFCPYCGGKVE